MARGRKTYGPCIGPECDKEATNKGEQLCHAHHEQKRLGKPLTPLRKPGDKRTKDGEPTSVETMAERRRATTIMTPQECYRRGCEKKLSLFIIRNNDGFCSTECARLHWGTYVQTATEEAAAA